MWGVAGVCGVTEPGPKTNALRILIIFGGGRYWTLVQGIAEKFQKIQNTVKPLNTADLGTGSGEKAAVFRKQRYWESQYNLGGVTTPNNTK